MAEDDLDGELFRVIAYLVTSASNAQGETLALAGFRLLDAASRLVTMAESSAAFADDSFLEQVREQFQQHFNEVMWDQPAFVRWLAELDADVVREARRRNLATP